MAEKKTVTKVCLCMYVLWNIFKAVQSQCAGTPLPLLASEWPKTFISPGYAIAYDNDLSCQWLIDSGVPNQRVLLYSDHFNISCTAGDFVTIYNGSSTSAIKMQANMCGRDLATGMFVSTGQYILVTFDTNSTIVDQGFQMTFLSAADTSGTACSEVNYRSASITAQYITSQRFPDTYLSNSSCHWIIQASSSLYTITMQLVWSDMEYDEGCIYDYLVIYDGSEVTDGNALLTACSYRRGAEDPPQIRTKGASALVIFTADANFEKQGFVLKYFENIVNSNTSTISAKTTMSHTSISSTMNLVTNTTAPPTTTFMQASTSTTIPFVTNTTATPATTAFKHASTSTMIPFVTNTTATPATTAFKHASTSTMIPFVTKTTAIPTTTTGRVPSTAMYHLPPDGYFLVMMCFFSGFCFF